MPKKLNIFSLHHNVDAKHYMSACNFFVYLYINEVKVRLDNCEASRSKRQFFVCFVVGYLGWLRQPK